MNYWEKGVLIVGDVLITMYKKYSNEAGVEPLRIARSLAVVVQRVCRRRFDCTSCCPKLPTCTETRAGRRQLGRWA